MLRQATGNAKFVKWIREGIAPVQPGREAILDDTERIISQGDLEFVIAHAAPKTVEALMPFVVTIGDTKMGSRCSRGVGPSQIVRERIEERQQE